ncbi:MAG: hypothetical protein JJ900_05025 [Rhodospirillales bacterium]|nr:hypothetical protein [Rhodospirillales bacterium]MBO6786193.1 hypothetical protein [Rhodospirillales bacterium]
MDAKRPTTAKAPDPWDIGFGVIVLAVSLLAIFVWFPADIKGGFFNTTPFGKIEPGDAFFPVLLAAALAVLSAIQLTISFIKGSPAPSAGSEGRLTRSNFRFLFIFFSICMAGLGIMFVLGPGIVWLMRELGLTDATYRHLTDTAPYKYIGYVVGGFLMTVTLITWTEGRVRPAGIVAVLSVLVVAIVVFDVLLTNVLLPPNAEF